MGGRLSIPKGPEGLVEGPRASSQRPFRLNQRTILGPLGAVVLGGIVFVYARTTIQAAKENAKRAREADGGSINWRNENARRHGRMQKPDERTLFGQLTGGAQTAEAAERARLATVTAEERNPIEEGIRRARERGKPKE